MRGRCAHPNFILLGDALRNAYNETDFVLNRLNNGIRGMWRGNVEHGRVRLYFADGLVAMLAEAATIRNNLRTSFTEPKIGSPRCVCPALVGETPPTIRVPYARASLVWKVPYGRVSNGRRREMRCAQSFPSIPDRAPSYPCG